MRILLLLAVVLTPAFGAFAQRQIVDLPDGWKFIRHDAAPDAAVGSDWQPVTIPHCWNALDGQNGKAADPGMPDGYYRGPTWYVRPLDAPVAWKGRRVFIRFEAAFQIADVYLNGQLLGQHRGGFTAFCFELTPHLKFGGPNELRVRLDNARNPDVLPLEADFTMEGGIYRPVHVLVTDQACITPLDFGGPGVYATPTNVSAAGAAVEVETRVDGAGVSRLQVSTEIKDAAGKPVAQQSAPLTGPSVKQTFQLTQPHLWNGRKDPYLYTVTARLQRDGKTIDEVTQPLGLRTVAVNEQTGFLLNGQPYPIHGVNRHQEKRDQGWALSAADHEADFKTILEMGATAVRLAHYPQSDFVHDLADHVGLLLWQEIPMVNGITNSPGFTANARQQLTEMIRQGSNHPSIFTWSVYNELYNMKDTAPPEALVAELDKFARELDPTRIPAAASDQPAKTDLIHVTEWIGFNIYPGWYEPGPEHFGRDVDKRYAIVNKRIALTEYGAGANPAMHQEGPLTQVAPKGQFHPEEWQAHVHEVDWAAARTNPKLWGTFIWAMFDFASDGRNEGGNPGVNDKGMITEDRKIKKDAFYFYKANWNPDPMVYLTARRMTPRKQARTEVKAYSNCDSVELKVNGQVIGSAKPDEIHVCRWPDVELKPGVNQIEVTAKGPTGPLTDRCEWTLTPAEASTFPSPQP